MNTLLLTLSVTVAAPPIELAKQASNYELSHKRCLANPGSMLIVINNHDDLYPALHAQYPNAEFVFNESTFKTFCPKGHIVGQSNGSMVEILDCCNVNIKLKPESIVTKPVKYTNGFNCKAGFCGANGGSGCPSCPNNSGGTCACGPKQSTITTPTITYQIPTFQSFGTSSCPNGNCPQQRSGR